MRNNNFTKKQLKEIADSMGNDFKQIVHIDNDKHRMVYYSDGSGEIGLYKVDALRDDDRFIDNFFWREDGKINDHIKYLEEHIKKMIKRTASYKEQITYCKKAIQELKIVKKKILETKL